MQHLETQLALALVALAEDVPQATVDSLGHVLATRIVEYLSTSIVR